MAGYTSVALHLPFGYNHLSNRIFSDYLILIVYPRLHVPRISRSERLRITVREEHFYLWQLKWAPS